MDRQGGPKRERAGGTVRKRPKPLRIQKRTREHVDRAQVSFAAQLERAGWKRTEKRFAVAFAAFNNAIVGLETEVQMLSEEVEQLKSTSRIEAKDRLELGDVIHDTIMCAIDAGLGKTSTADLLEKRKQINTVLNRLEGKC